MTRLMQDGEELMSYMDTHAAFAPAGGIQELSFDEVLCVGGGNGARGNSTAGGSVAGAGAGAAAGYAAGARAGAQIGGRIGAFAGPVGAVVGLAVGAVLGGVIGYVSHTVAAGEPPKTRGEGEDVRQH